MGPAPLREQRNVDLRHRPARDEIVQVRDQGANRRQSSSRGTAWHVDESVQESWLRGPPNTYDPGPTQFRLFPPSNDTEYACCQPRLFASCLLVYSPPSQYQPDRPQLGAERTASARATDPERKELPTIQEAGSKDGESAALAFKGTAGEAEDSDERK